MSRTYSTGKNKKQQLSKVYVDQYLYNAGEPPDDMHRYSRAELEAEQLEDSYGMKRQVRRTAQRLRNRYA